MLVSGNSSVVRGQDDYAGGHLKMSTYPASVRNKIFWVFMQLQVRLHAAVRELVAPEVLHAQSLLMCIAALRP